MFYGKISHMENYCVSLNPEQKKAVEIINGPVLVIAGAGSGKTRVLTAHICHLIQNGIDPSNILAITFTNKAANEMKERIDQYIGHSAVWASTFHSLCARLLRMDIDNLEGYNRDFTIYSQEESERVVKDILKANANDYKFKTKEFYVDQISTAKSKCMDADAYFNFLKVNRYFSMSEIEMIDLVYRKYEKTLKLSNALDFDDLLSKTVELFETHPNILEKYQDRFKYINVDEFQDTNTLQSKLVDLLSKKHGNIFVVGDEDQSIYSWRGAEIQNILDFPKNHPGTQIVTLEQNYRSTTSILDAANQLISQNTNRNVKNLWSEDKQSNSVEYYDCYDDRNEADKAVGIINYFHNLNVPFSEMAVLVRSTSITRLLEERLKLYQIPYKVFGGFKFYERAEIKNVFAYLKLAINPSDGESISRIINVPPRGIGEKSLQDLKILADEKDYNLYTMLINLDKENPKMHAKFEPFIELINDLIEKYHRLEPAEFVKYAIDRSKIRTAYEVEKDEDNRQKIQNIEELASDIAMFMQENPNKDLTDYLESVALISDQDDAVDGDYVAVSTVHAAKGLEYANVILMGLEEGLFPSSMSVDEGQIEEERRLMYVAITRAKKHLFVLDAQRRFRFGQVKDQSRSRFIKEMRVVPKAFVDPFAAKSHTLNNKIYEQKEEKKVNNVNFKDYKYNTIVRHAKFGDGVIVDVEELTDDKKVTIEFKMLGRKTFSLSIAYKFLEIIGNIDETEGC